MIDRASATSAPPTADLPLWMQKTLRQTDWGALIVLALSLLAGWSFMFTPGLPRTNASEHYAFRAADGAQAIMEGRLYPRWSPNALNGYGAPIPNFYPPAPTYLPALIDAFFTGSATAAIRIVYVAAFVLAGAAVYAFVTRRSGAAAGVIAALFYVYSPSVGLIAPRVLGDLPSMISLALLPTLLWSVDRLVRVNGTPDFLYVALAAAALLLTDPPTALIGGLIAAALLLADRPNRRRGSAAASAGVLGALIAAFFWLPALAEANAIQWYARPPAIPQTLTLRELITPLRPLDPAALIAPPQFTLGIALVLGVLVSAPLIVRRRSGFHGLFFIAGLMLMVVALVLLPAETWLLGAVTLCFAIAASALTLHRRARALLPVLVIGILAAAVPAWLIPLRDEPPIDMSPLAQVQYEQQGYGIAGLPEGDPLPASIAPALPPPSRDLIASYRAGVVGKLQPDSSAQIGVLEHGTHGDRFQLETFAPLTLHVLTAAFPGWTARLNGAVIPFTPTDSGLIDLTLPDAARGELQIALEATPPRLFGWGIAAAALALTLLVTGWRARDRRLRRTVDPYEPLDLLAASEARLLWTVTVGFAVVLGLVALPASPLAVRAQSNYALDGAFSLDNRSEVGLEVLAYRLTDDQLAPGDTLQLTLYWHTLRFLTSSEQVRLSLLDLSTGQYRQPTALRQPGGYPTTRWLPRFYVSDPYAIPLPPDFPAGRYSPAVEVFTCAAACEPNPAPGDRLTFFDQRGSPYGSVLVLPIVLTVK